MLSPLSTAREQKLSSGPTHVTTTFGFRPRHIDMWQWQWSLVMGARLFLETQGIMWWGGG